MRPTLTLDRVTQTDLGENTGHVSHHTRVTLHPSDAKRQALAICRSVGCSYVAAYQPSTGWTVEAMPHDDAAQRMPDILRSSDPRARYET